MTSLVFYIFATILIFAAIRVVTVKNPVHASLFLVLAFFTSAGIWLLLEAEFLAITLVLVYVGAVMVLFLFVIMMLDIDHKTLREGFGRYFAIGSFVAVVVLLELYMVFKAKGSDLATTTAKAMAEDVPNTVALGKVLYTDYLYPFELAAMLLLVAMVAAITLTMRPRRSNKYQEPSKQVEVKASDRLKVLKMPAEKAE